MGALRAKYCIKFWNILNMLIYSLYKIPQSLWKSRPSHGSLRPRASNYFCSEHLLSDQSWRIALMQNPQKL